LAFSQAVVTLDSESNANRGAATSAASREQQARHVLAFERLAEALSAALDDPLDPSQPGAREIKHDLVRVAHLIAEQEFAEARQELLRLDDLLTDLQAVGPHIPGYLPEVRMRLIRDDGRDGYLGTRAELSAAEWLVRHKVNVRRGSEAGGEPDFMIERPGGVRCGFECTSAHLTSLKEANVYKIRRAIRRKSRSRYCGPDAALYVEYTAILRRAGEAVEVGFQSRIKRVIQSTSWGAVILSCLILRRGAKNLERAYLRFDGASISPSLRALLDEILPHGEVYVGHVSVPPKP
jgi:hypothetical protein